nr:MAG TPA: anaerobic ribonucleoside triphosphate reductase [Caudoviricetes sp.]
MRQATPACFVPDVSLCYCGQNKSCYNERCNMADKKTLQKQINEIKEQMKDIHGSKCEVYSRVVGYLRPVQGWNKGKKEEYAMRKMYEVEHPKRSCGC